MSTLPTLSFPDQERLRLGALYELDLLDSAPDPDIDRLTALAAHCLNMPICLLALADRDRFWLKSRQGVEWTDYPRQGSFCESVLQGQQGMVCPNLAIDPRFTRHPQVNKGKGPVQFYAGEPLWSGAQVIGTLCVQDARPRPDFSAEQQHLLAEFAKVVSDALRSRQMRHLADWEKSLHANGPVATLVWSYQDDQFMLVHRSANLESILGPTAAVTLAAGAPLRAITGTSDEALVEQALTVHVPKPIIAHDCTFQLKSERRWLRLVTHGDGNAAGQLSRVRGYLIDISDQKELESRIEATREHLQLALEAAQIATWELNLQTGERTHGPRTAAMLGYTNEELGNSNERWTELIHPADRELVRHKISRRLALSDEQLQQLPVFSVEYRIQHKSRRYIWVQSFGKLVARDEHGRPLRAVGTLMDITHAKMAERQRTQRQRVLDLVNATQHAFLHSKNLKAACEALFEALLDLTDSQFGFIGVVHKGPDGRPILHVPAITNVCWNDTSRQWYESHMANEGELVFTQLDNLFGHVVTHDRVVCTNQLKSHPASRGTPPGHPVIDNFLGIPLHHERRVVGMIALGNRNEGYSEEMVALLEPLSTMLGTLIQARAEEDARHKAAEQWREQATVDSLTGLANRRRFFDVVNQFIPQLRRYGSHASVVLLDLDHFKKVNDTYGHASGDAVLRVFGQLIAAAVRDTDLAARIGGEEFAVFMPSTSPLEALVPLERIRLQLNDRVIECDGHTIRATVSMGVAGWSKDHDTLEKWMSQADLALYEAKAQGRNRIELIGH